MMPCRQDFVQGDPSVHLHMLIVSTLFKFIYFYKEEVVLGNNVFCNYFVAEMNSARELLSATGNTLAAFIPGLTTETKATNGNHSSTEQPKQSGRKSVSEVKFLLISYIPFYGKN